MATTWEPIEDRALLWTCMFSADQRLCLEPFIRALPTKLGRRPLEQFGRFFAEATRALWRDYLRLSSPPSADMIPPWDIESDDPPPSPPPSPTRSPHSSPILHQHKRPRPSSPLSAAPAPARHPALALHPCLHPGQLRLRAEGDYG
jgi:hypothetical protein